jgi:hypothetical protein
MDHSKKALTPKAVTEHYPELTTSTGVSANWRHLRKGPKFYKVSRRVVYKPSDIEDYLFRNPILTIDSV